MSFKLLYFSAKALMKNFRGSTLLLTAALSALTPNLFAATVVVPNANTSANGNNYTFIPLGETNGVTFQFDLAASQLTSLAGQDINAIGFRLGAGVASVGPTVVPQFSLEASSSANALGSLSTNFASNIGANAETVYSGSLSLGPLTGGAGPNPFFLINFMTPYLYTGGDLLFTLDTSGSPTNAIELDANTVDSNGNTVGNINSEYAAAGTADYFNYPIVELTSTAAVSPTPSAVPEPSSLVLMLTGMGAVAGQLRRRFNRT